MTNMNKFGILKEKILSHLIENYEKKDKKKMKEIVSKMKQKDFKELYLFYENFENKTITDDYIIEQYIEETEKLLKVKLKECEGTINELSTLLEDVSVEENVVYSMIDNLVSESTLSNLEEKISVKKNIREHLKSEKKPVEEAMVNFSSNEKLLHTVLTNNFNTQFNESLSDSEKEIFLEAIQNKDERPLFEELKENVLSKLNDITTSDLMILNKIQQTKDKIVSENFNGRNRTDYVDLLELKNSL